MTEQEFIEYGKLHKQLRDEANLILRLYAQAYKQIWDKNVTGIDYLKFDHIDWKGKKIVYTGEESLWGGDRDHHYETLPVEYLFQPDWLNACIANMALDKKQRDDQRAESERKHFESIKAQELAKLQELKKKYEG